MVVLDILTLLSLLLLLVVIVVYIDPNIIEDVLDFFRDENIERLVRAAKKGNMLPLAKRIIKDKHYIYDILCYVRCDRFTEKERGEIMNICFNLIRLKKFPKNSEKMELEVRKLEEKFQSNGWNPEYNEAEEFKDDGDGGSKKAEAIKAKAKKIN